ncbi:MAG: hypothetical protein HDR88_08995 [Bacteroides sp.]|nr:hypothetical protein [Bacteroides sp.]
MKNKKLYIVSFGNSERYSILFDGSREEFENSAEFRHIKNTVFDYVKTKFPDFDCERYLAPQIREATQRDEIYPELNADNLGKLKHDVTREIEAIQRK